MLCFFSLIQDHYLATNNILAQESPIKSKEHSLSMIPAPSMPQCLVNLPKTPDRDSKLRRLYVSESYPYPALSLPQPQQTEMQSLYLTPLNRMIVVFHLVNLGSWTRLSKLGEICRLRPSTIPCATPPLRLDTPVLRSTVDKAGGHPNVHMRELLSIPANPESPRV